MPLYSIYDHQARREINGIKKFVSGFSKKTFPNDHFKAFYPLLDEVDNWQKNFIPKNSRQMELREHVRRDIIPMLYTIPLISSDSYIHHLKGRNYIFVPDQDTSPTRLFEVAHRHFSR